MRIQDIEKSSNCKSGDADHFDDDQLHTAHEEQTFDKEQPKEGFSKIPILILFLVAALVFWGGIYMANNSANFRSDIYDPKWQPSASGNETAKTWDPIKRGEKLFRSNCAACHQMSGQGVAGVFPPLVGSAWVVGDEQRLVKILLRGLNGPIQVKGNLYDGNMPSYGENGINWNDRDIEAISTYIRHAWNNEAPPISSETVASVRELIKGKTNAWTVDEL